MEKQISEKKQRLFDEYLNSPIEIGEELVIDSSLLPFGYPGKNSTVRVKSVDGEKITVSEGDLYDKNGSVITKEQIKSRKGLYYVGACPMVSRDHAVRFVVFSLHSILFNTGIIESTDNYKTSSGHIIKRANFNPFIFDGDGNKIYYQRPYVWTQEENQMLIESIYQRIECGRILVRKRSWAECELMGEEAAFMDIVDGKQRLNAIRGFINNEYPDLHGNYYADLSNMCQGEFTNHQLFSYAEMDEDTPDTKVIEQFLKLNFAGVPQSKEHIDFIKSIKFK